MICALLIDREGLCAFPGTNICPVLGRPLFAYPLMAARDAVSVDRIYVSTNSPRFKETAAAYGAEIIERPAELATNAALGEDAYQIYLRSHKGSSWLALGGA